MALDFLAVGTRAQSASAASIAPAKPAVNTIRGALLALVWSKNNAVHSTATPGWTLIGQQNSGASFTASLWIAAEGASAPTFTWAGAATCGAQISYYGDIDNPTSATIGATSVSSGIGATHTSTAIVSTVANSLAVYADAAAANTAIAQPTGWTEDVDNGSATDSARDAFGHKALATVGTSSGAISVTGANAAWVQWQVELVPAAATGLEETKIEAGAWIDNASAIGMAKIEAGAWIDGGTYGMAKIEAGAWIDGGSYGMTKIEAGAWIDVPAVVPGNRRMSLM